MSDQDRHNVKSTALETFAYEKPQSPWAVALRRLASNKLAIAGSIIILAMIVFAIFAPLIAPHNPNLQNISAILQSPSSAHIMGTDILGRDIFSRLVYGARISLAVGIFVQIIILLIGMPIGAIAGFTGGRTDNLLMRFTDIMYAFPDLLLIILFKFIFGEGIYMIFLAIGLVNWTNIARLMRGQVLTLKQREFVTASRAMGASNRHIILRHLLPNSLSPIIVSVTFNIPRAIFAEAALSFIGIGVKVTTPSWGKMIADGIDTIFASPYPILFPAIAIALLVMSFSFLGDGLRDALDPRITE
ncbi:ABC transporter permease [Chloroflexota bacterium]